MKYLQISDLKRLVFGKSCHNHSTEQLNGEETGVLENPAHTEDGAIEVNVFLRTSYRQT